MSISEICPFPRALLAASAVIVLLHAIISMRIQGRPIVAQYQWPPTWWQIIRVLGFVLVYALLFIFSVIYVFGVTQQASREYSYLGLAFPIWLFSMIIVLPIYAAYHEWKKPKRTPLLDRIFLIDYRLQFLAALGMAWASSWLQQFCA